VADWAVQSWDINISNRHRKEEKDPMKIRRLLSLTTLGLATQAAWASDTSQAVVPRQAVIRVERPGVVFGADVPVTRMRTLKTSAPAAAYSAELPQISRVQGQAFYRTAVDISNNTSNAGVVARVQYSYTCTGAGGCPAGTLFRTNPVSIPLAAIDNFHSDDFVQYLGTQSLAGLQAGAVEGSFGTLLVTFDNLPSATGWEGTVVARNYNRLVEADPSQGTVGYSYPASLFFESAHQTVVGTIRDTTPAALAGGVQGSQRTNLGVRNTDIHQADFPVGTPRPVSVDVTFYDVTQGSPTNGDQVGITLSLDNLQPGEVRQFSNVFSAAQIPANVSSAIAFVDVRNPTSTSPTIEGYFNIGDNVTQDFSFFEMKCGDTGGTCGQ
jgi:hypothetical protein